LRLVFGTLDLPDTSLAPRLLDRFYAGGGRAVDVANVYRDGEAEEAVGRWLSSRRSADDVVLYAKGCLWVPRTRTRLGYGPLESRGAGWVSPGWVGSADAYSG
jgi:aryl-alcohol dehydrogenase-like predicted oxidoreductase